MKTIAYLILLFWFKVDELLEKLKLKKKDSIADFPNWYQIISLKENEDVEIKDKNGKKYILEKRK